MSSLIPTGIYKGRAISAEYKISGVQKKEYLEIRCEITQEGPFKGRQMCNEQWFNKQENGERALRTLLACGWDGEDPLEPVGLGSTEVDLDIEVEEERPKEDGEGVYAARNRVAWINEMGASALGRMMTEEEKGGFASRLLGLKAHMRIEKRAPGQAPTLTAAAAPRAATANGATQMAMPTPTAPGAAVMKPSF